MTKEYHAPKVATAPKPQLAEKGLNIMSSSKQKIEEAPKLTGILAEFRNPRELTDAASLVVNAGYTDFDTFSPFPIHGIDKAMKA